MTHVLKTDFDQLMIVQPILFADARGFLQKHLASEWLPGLDFDPIDIYSTTSHCHVFRGFHYQCHPYGQYKLVSCIAGSFIDYALDLRRKSCTYGQIHQIKLDASIPLSVLVPPGFAHATYSLQNHTVALSICAGKYQPVYERAICVHGLEQKLNIENSRIILSEKDSASSPFIAGSTYSD